MFKMLISSNHRGENLKFNHNGSARILQKSVANELDGKRGGVKHPDHISDQLKIMKGIYWNGFRTIRIWILF